MRAHATLNREFAKDPVWGQASMREYDVLYTLAKAGCSLSQSDLVNDVLLSQPALSRMLARMEEKGLVKRLPDPRDRRSAQIQLTERGRELQRAIGRAHSRQIADALGSALTLDQVRQLESICDALAADSAGAKP